MFPHGMLHLCPPLCCFSAARATAWRPARQDSSGPLGPALPLPAHSRGRAPAAPALLALSLILSLILSLALDRPALAETIRVSAAADAGAAPVQARQQALERAFVEAVFQTAQRLLPAPLPEPRAALLRQHLAPRAANLVQSFQEISPAKQAAPAATAQAQTDPVALDLDVEVNRAVVSDLLVRLGLQAGARHPRVFALGLAGGVAEQELKPLADLLALQNLTRVVPAQGQAPVQVSLERVPQGFLKAVLRQDAQTFVADGRDLAQLWLDIWGQYFSAREQQPGGGATSLEVSGFALVDGLLDFTRTLASWDDCLREVQLHVADIRPGNSAARWSARVTNPERLNARLQEYLPSRKLKALR